MGTHDGTRRRASAETPAEQVTTAAGVLAPTIALGAIFLATVLSPTFTWTSEPLSFLGSSGEPTRPLFNYGLILGGLVSLPFAARLVGTARNRLESVGGGAFALTGVAMALVGGFPMGTEWHFPAAVSFYLLLSVSMWCYGGGNLLAGDRRVGATTVGLGLLNLLTWVVYVAVFAPTGLSLALPEIVGALALGGWTTATAFRLF
ncbi:DUF998 domain-containing protein [Halomarina oriensis]|uniref:DUF998 domain-containing protein n=1 Tax=Halomarina oriensis TaxID=671145 RepID=A0A6B0GKL6_9EURY|nr:DUF998 domain-containing protein [Halomarina oriensis]MWG33969.1 DUF998 domain-containing protein [Halomarina oriensis]